ncbi:MAG: redoxin domain-containing protein [Anaerolineales bacterium]
MTARTRLVLLLGGGLLFGALLGLVILLAAQQTELFPPNGAQPAGLQSGAPSIGKPAVDFELETLTGEAIHLSDLRGKVVLLNFWATWCGPCRAEMPAIQARYAALQPDLVVLAVNDNETQSDVQAFVDELGITFPVLLDPRARVNRAYLITALPTTFIIDAEGIIRAQHIGSLSERQLDGYLQLVGLNP